MNHTNATQLNTLTALNLREIAKHVRVCLPCMFVNWKIDVIILSKE